VQTVISSELTLEPFTQTDSFMDVYGNPCVRLQFPQGDIHIDYSATVSIPDRRLPMLKPIELSAVNLPTDTLLYTLPSRYCQSDQLVNMAFDQFGDAQPGWARVQTICEWINRHISYRYGTSDTGTSAYDTAAQRQGVCRDFAHLGISFCRALSIPARYVAGYCLGLDPPDFHAWFEAYLDGHWVAFDATERQPRPALVMMTVGRDAADCAWSTFYGIGSTKTLSVEVCEDAPEQTA
jgi:transglutaminase-like putative cysteine protease